MEIQNAINSLRGDTKNNYSLTGFPKELIEQFIDNGIIRERPIYTNGIKYPQYELAHPNETLIIANSLGGNVTKDHELSHGAERNPDYKQGITDIYNSLNKIEQATIVWALQGRNYDVKIDRNEDKGQIISEMAAHIGSGDERFKNLLDKYATGLIYNADGGRPDLFNNIQTKIYNLRQGLGEDYAANPYGNIARISSTEAQIPSLARQVLEYLTSSRSTRLNENR